MDTHYHGRLVGRAQQVGWWSLRRLLGRPQRGRHDDNDPQQQQQQQQPGQNAGTAANFTPDWRGIRQGWPAGVTCSHLEESWFAADVVPSRGDYCYCGCGQSVAHRDEEDEEEDEERQKHREEVARATLAEMLHDAVPFALSDGSASGRADPRITVYVTLGCGAAAWEGAGGGVEGYLQRLQAIGEFDFVKEVDVAVAEAGEGGLCVDDDDRLDAGMYWRQMIPHEACHHVTEVVPLGDAARMRRILAVGEVTGQWGEGQRGRRPRLLALAHHSHAFCLDACLGAWWRRCGEQTVRAGMERVMRADGLAEEQQQGVVLPEVVPAVRFKIQWPGLEAPRIVDGEVCWEA
ncbi:hypothetical protein OOU_Y34scaffold00589g27 [Pyricularia oryzae Y34]|uniref:Uncharacterized protein n=1 Tax=Pyricularia oryzae (strain Y34) TaxID=1143189 RepID=A0AA97NWK3_PYRO3|nr:hypothetical protein OOU_Y34scaffold00589g27 [Pyricularia oryzae Y34]